MVHNHGPDEPGVRCREYRVNGVLRGTCLDDAEGAPRATAGLPIPPPGTCWEVTGTPRGPWVWSSGIHYADGECGLIAEPWAIASASGASAIWRPC